MSWFINLKTGLKLAIGFGICLFLAVLVGVVAVNRMSLMNRTMSAALDDSVVGMHALARVNAEARHLRTLEFQHVLTDDPQVRSGFESDMNQALATVQSGMDEYGASITDPVDSKNFANLKASWSDYMSDHDSKFMKLSRNDRDKEAESLLNGAMRKKFHDYTNLLSDMLQWNHTHGMWYGRVVNCTYRSAAMLVIILLIVSLISAALVANFIARLITTSIADVADRLRTLEQIDLASLRGAVQAMETGDLTAEVNSSTTPLVVKSTDELGQMAGTFNGMLEQLSITINAFRSSQDTLRQMVRSLQSTANHVSTASETLAASAEQIGAGSEQIAATMEEVARATEQSARGATEVAQGATNQAEALGSGAELVSQLAHVVNSVARDAEITAHSAEKADEVATEGSDAVAQAIEGMERIRTAVSESAGVIGKLGDASSQIGAIVGTIEEIADQTNLLALNAAIEAARAGDAGRGFAVVADEVRKLAERSRLATHDIGRLILSVQSHTAEAVTAMQVGSTEVSKGCDLATGAGKALAQIKREMSAVSGQVQNICSAAEEMLASSEEVSRSISDVTVVVQQSSAAAEEMSASSEEVSASVQSVAGTLAEQTPAVQNLVDSSLELSRVAASLKESADKFIVGDELSNSPALTLVNEARPTLGATVRKAA